MVKGMLQLLSNCPSETAHLRKELLIAAKHILTTDLRSRMCIYTCLCFTHRFFTVFSPVKAEEIFSLIVVYCLVPGQIYNSEPTIFFVIKLWLLGDFSALSHELLLLLWVKPFSVISLIVSCINMYFNMSISILILFHLFPSNYFFSGIPEPLNHTMKMYLVVFQNLFLVWTNFLMNPSWLVLATLPGRLLGKFCVCKLSDLIAVRALCLFLCSLLSQVQVKCHSILMGQFLVLQKLSGKLMASLQHKSRC